MFTRAAQQSIFLLALLSATFGTAVLARAAVAQSGDIQPSTIAPSRQPPAPVQGAVADQTAEVQKLRDRVSALEGELKGFNRAVAASIQATDNYTKYLGILATVIGLLFTIGGFFGGRWINEKGKQVEAARRQIEPAKKELASAIAIARAVPALLRSNLEEKDPDRKRLHAREAYRYITQAESKGYTDSHLLNWKAYTLRRMDLREQALQAAQDALKIATADDPQKARALYNIACYYSAFRPGEENQALNFLEQAILADEWYKAVALRDSDLDSIRNNTGLKHRFEQLVK